MNKKKDDTRPPTGQTPAGEERPGSGALCDQAQADGVPCFEIGKECETCEHAKPGWRRQSEG
jgi:hypothetical protein